MSKKIITSGNGKYTLSGRLQETLYALNEDLHGDLIGKTLTVIDASVSNLEQRKAVKDIMRNMLGTVSNRMYEAIHGILDSVSVIVGDSNDTLESGSSVPGDYISFVKTPDYKYTREE